MKIRKIETFDYEGPVYNIEVEQNHNYYVEDVLVSNCHENSTKKGEHADLKLLMPMLRSCLPGTEIAIGGGNALAHPFIQTFVQGLSDRGFVPSMTINQKHLQKYWYLIKRLKLNGIGISLTDPNNKKDFTLINDLGPNVVIHIIAGIVKPSDYKVLKDRKVLILGYKDIRRGHDNLVKNSEEIKANIEQLKKDLPMLSKMCRAISFDCLALKQLNPKEVLGMTDEEFANIYQGDDYEMYDENGNLTVGTMFIDAVNMQIARSSTAPMDKRYKFTGNEDIRELLAKSCEGYV
jgi:hypothetical protein